ncbi:MAG: divalent-cation tolerance protein CutA [Candidatus Rokuibacteriota bacterium]|nr:MAG: divalent-cation tolerance protein CutA [Candidatus Rokubacteria bacterium]
MTEGRGPLVVLVTAPSEAIVLELGQRLVDDRLAACVSVVPGVTSIFMWEGKREEASEALLVIKTRAERYPALQQRVLELHPYSVPEVLALAVEAGAPAYLRWVQDSVAG